MAVATKHDRYNASEKGRDRHRRYRKRKKLANLLDANPLLRDLRDEGFVDIQQLDSGDVWIRLSSVDWQL